MTADDEVIDRWAPIFRRAGFDMDAYAIDFGDVSNEMVVALGEAALRKLASGPVYVASSWRNVRHAGVLAALRAAGVDVYDFKADGAAFGWHEADPDNDGRTAEGLIRLLDTPVAIKGYHSDWGAMRNARAGVLVLSAGRSAHLEAGYFVGAGVPLHVLLDDGQEPELMYRMAYETGGCLHANLDTLVAALRPGAGRAVEV
jgi:hypothetical protein